MGWTVCIWKAVNCVSTVSDRKGFGCFFFNTSISDVPLQSIWEQKRGVKFGCCVGSPPTCLLNLTKLIGRLDINECHHDCLQWMACRIPKWSLLPQNLKCGLVWRRKSSLMCRAQLHTLSLGHSTELSLFYGEGSQMNHLCFPMKNLIIFLGCLPRKLCLSTCDPRKL